MSRRNKGKKDSNHSFYIVLALLLGAGIVIFIFSSKGNDSSDSTLTSSQQSYPDIYQLIDNAVERTCTSGGEVCWNGQAYIDSTVNGGLMQGFSADYSEFGPVVIGTNVLSSIEYTHALLRKEVTGTVDVAEYWLQNPQENENFTNYLLRNNAINEGGVFGDGLAILVLSEQDQRILQATYLYDSRFNGRVVTLDVFAGDQITCDHVLVVHIMSLNGEIIGNGIPSVLDYFGCN